MEDKEDRKGVVEHVFSISCLLNHAFPVLYGVMASEELAHAHSRSNDRSPGGFGS